MRIRTIKPSFWTNEKMSALPDFTRLFAVAILNYADDHGYFWANPLMIRGALFPFEEDSSKVRKALSQLESIGYVRLGKMPDGRECGMVTKFPIHQKVEKKQDSEIQKFIVFNDQADTIPRPVADDSANGSRMIADDSVLYRKGREGKGKEEDSAADAPLIIPLLLNTPEFLGPWSQWVEVRRKGKKPKTDWNTYLLGQLEWLETLGLQVAIDTVATAARNQWQGLFEQRKGGAQQQPVRQPVRMGVNIQ